MKDFDSLLNIWNEQKNSPALDYKEVLSRFKRSRNKFSLKIWIELSFMTLVSLFILYVWLNMKFNFITTHISLLILLSCSVIYIYQQIKNLKALTNDSLLETPEKHIAFIESFRKDRYKQNTSYYYLCILAVGVALSLYFIEYFEHVNTITLVSSIVFTMIWFAVCTFLIRKVYMKKEEKRFKEMLEDLERLKKQFSDEA